MKVLVINCGSSSLKYQLIDSETESVLAKGLCERIGIDGALTHQPAGKDKIKSTPVMTDHKTAIGIVIDQLTDKENGVVESLDEIGAVGHRIVHGGEKFTKSCLITDEVIKEVEECSVFAPLHNPAGLIGVLNVLKNFFIAIIICAYFLNSKDLFAAQSKKVIVAFFSEHTAKEILDGASFTNKTFGGFINGKIIDSLIIGLLCFVCMTIFGWEYTLLISCIVGITNIIPFFGPFIGAIPSALLLLMVDPEQCMWFLVFILALQQFDGNILGPKILGDSTGLASFWVLFAVLVGGGLFGFIGMVIGIPVFAIIYAYATRSINRRLAKRGFSTDISDYMIDSYRVKKKKKKRWNWNMKRKGGRENGQNENEKETD